MFGEHVAQGEIAFGFVGGEFGDVGWWRRDDFTEDAAHDPVAALDGTGAEAGGVLREGDGHGEEGAAAVGGGVGDVGPRAGGGRVGDAVVFGERGR